MQTMQSFYNQLFSSNLFSDAYWARLVKLTQLQREQITALQTVILWDDWHEKQA